MPLSITYQARALRRLTGLPLARAREIILAAQPQPRRPKMRQPTLDERPISEEELATAFRELREQIAGKGERK